MSKLFRICVISVDFTSKRNNSILATDRFRTVVEVCHSAKGEVYSNIVKNPNRGLFANLKYAEGNLGWYWLGLWKGDSWFIESLVPCGGKDKCLTDDEFTTKELEAKFGPKHADCCVGTYQTVNFDRKKLHNTVESLRARQGQPGRTFTHTPTVRKTPTPDHRKKLCEEDIIGIQIRLGEGITQKQIAVEYGITQARVSQIKQNRSV